MDNSKNPLSRREFCKVTAAAVATAAGLKAMPATGAGTTQPQRAFASSFEDIPETFGPTNVRFNKPLPANLKGTLFRNGPARMQRGNTKYHHWFDGDGMVHSFTLNGNEVTHRGKMIRTDRYVAEEKAGRFLRGGFGTTFKDSFPVQKPDDLNVANISVLPLGDEILALWEAGSAWRINSDSLDTLGRKVFSPETDGLPFSAHPRIDKSGQIWNFGYMMGSGKLVLYDIAANGALNRVSLIDAPNANMVHDFAITERYLVFVLQPLVLKAKRTQDMPIFDQLQWDPDDSVKVLVVDKQSLKIAHQLELPSFFAFHLGNAWEDNKNIHIEIATAPAYEPFMQQIIQATSAQPISKMPEQPQAAEILLDLRNKRASLAPLPTHGLDFPRFDQRYTGSKTQQLYMLGRSADMPESIFGFNRVCAMNRLTDSDSFFDYDSDTVAEEHIFVPNPGKQQGAGWLIGTSYNWREGKTSLSVFNAEQVQDGPITRAELPYHLPLGLHGQFVM